MLAGYLASIVESVGDYYACARLAGAPPPDERTVSRGIGMEGIGCLVAGIFGTGNGTTSYSENIGAIGLTRVGSRRVVQTGAAIMIVLACFGKFGGLFTTIPSPIVGGMYCTMFGMITAVGLSNLQFVDLNSARNLFILGFAFFMGISVPEYFGGELVDANKVDFLRGVDAKLLAGNKFLLAEKNLLHFDFAPWLSDVLNTLGKTGMAVGALCALVLDNTVPGTREERGLAAWGMDKQ
jgi:nucleobase transporter 1/2